MSYLIDRFGILLVGGPISAGSCSWLHDVSLVIPLPSDPPQWAAVRHSDPPWWHSQRGFYKPRLRMFQLLGIESG